jgi:hypothetical protein
MEDDKNALQEGKEVHFSESAVIEDIEGTFEVCEGRGGAGNSSRTLIYKKGGIFEVRGNDKLVITAGTTIKRVQK